MRELRQPEMPEIKVHEYTPLLDSSDMGPCDWARLAVDIKEVRVCEERCDTSRRHF